MSKKGSMGPGTVITDTQTGITATIVGRYSDGKYKARITKDGVTALTRVSSIPPAEDTDAQAEFVKKMEYALEVESKKKTSPPRKVRAPTGRIFMVSTLRKPQTKTVKSRSRSRSSSRSKSPSPRKVRASTGRIFTVRTVKKQRGGKKHRKTHRKKNTKKTKKNKSKK